LTNLNSIPWQQLAAQELDQPGEPRLRMSNAGKCPRALAYAAQGIPESDPPDGHSRNRMALGHMAEVLILRDLESRGWETDHTVLSPGGQLELELKVPGAGAAITGHPDGVCRHPEFTRDRWITLECKSMSISRGQETEERGVAEVYPQYLAQISLYARRLHQMGLVCHPERGLFAMMDRDGRPLPPERVSWEPELADGVLEKLKDLLREVEARAVPERPQPASSMECRYCSYHSLCRGPRTEKEEPANGRKASVLSQDPEVKEAAAEWLELKPRMDRVKDVLQEASDEAGKIDVAAGGVTAGYFQPKNRPNYDAGELERLVPADILRRCLSPRQDRRQGFWIRKSSY
jgi:CRISPR/Cas system-associated exonuclease Cas4 (RecB family)